MSMSAMTPNGELEIPTRGSTSPEVIAKLAYLENAMASAQQEISALKNSIAGEDYGLVKLSDRTDVTADGIALSARQNNPAIVGTLANSVQAVTNELNESVLKNIRFLGVIRLLDSELGSVAAQYNVPDHVIYMATQVPKTGGPYIQGGGSHIVIGMEYGGHRYGTQVSFGPYLKRRTLQDGAWGEWETVQTI